jgi:GR25 family glycosyltransferase involved in LPS biosynthesis
MEIKVLSLKSAKERREYMKSQLVGSSFSFFDALSPSEINPELFENKSDFLSIEAVATFESHRKIISSCKNTPLLILEDDATPIELNYLSQIDSTLTTKHSWDIIIIGYFPDPNFLGKFKNICDNFIKLDGFLGMHSYIINPIGVKKIIEHLGEPTTHIDYRISELISQDKITGIFTNKPIFRQNNWDFKSQIPKARDLLNNGKNK